MTTDRHPGDADERVLDALLGELSGDDLAAFEADRAEDAALAADHAATADLLDRLRGLETEPTTRLGAVLHRAARQRLLLRRGGATRRAVAGRVLFETAAIVATAAALLFGLRLLDAWRQEPASETRATAAGAGGPDESLLGSLVTPPADELPAATAAQLPLEMVVVPDPVEPPLTPVEGEAAGDGTAAGARDERVADVVVPATHPDDLRGVVVELLRAENEVSMLRAEFRRRFSPVDRLRALRAAGHSRLLAARIDDLASGIAAQLEAAPVLSIEDASYGLRALLAAGSTARLGPHRDAVDRCVRRLEDAVPALQGSELAVALAGLVDLAVVTQSPTGQLVGEHAERLALDSLEHVEPGKGLRNWATPVDALADAGRVLMLAPAFGCSPVAASRAREALVEHLDERAGRHGVESPEVRAAQLYGFADVVDLDAVDRSLELWSPRLLRDHVAVFHLSWGQFPLRRGWAAFQRELRGLMAVDTPAATRDRCALLLALAASFAAPADDDADGRGRAAVR